ncbi:hypothetical protein, partial [Corallococcus sp. CA053C]|uniref:hypothetical protein n=1 Tax=Corallococcus sp. CA053C TaxID=2316732 RepID=UPI0018F3B288
MMKNRSRFALALSAVLLTSWALPAAAQDPQPTRRTGTVRKAGTAKTSGTGKTSRRAKTSGTSEQTGTAKASGSSKQAGTLKQAGTGTKRRGKSKAGAAQEPAQDAPLAES